MISSIEAVLLSGIVGVCSALLAVFATHWTAKRRELEKKTTDIRIEYLIDCWIKIERAANVPKSVGRDQKNKFYDDLEQALAKIILLGDPSEVEAAKKFARDMAAGSNASVNDLLNSLRRSLREKLKLEQVGALDLFFRMQREKP